jgi:hypothetical protein
VDIPFRYNISPTVNMKTNVFRPTTLEAGMDKESLRSVLLGAVMQGNFHQLVNNSRCSLVWEARLGPSDFASQDTQ